MTWRHVQEDSDLDYYRVQEIPSLAKSADVNVAVCSTLIVSPLPNCQVGGPLVVGYPLLLINK